MTGCRPHALDQSHGQTSCTGRMGRTGLIRQAPFSRPRAGKTAAVVGRITEPELVELTASARQLCDEARELCVLAVQARQRSWALVAESCARRERRQVRQQPRR